MLPMVLMSVLKWHVSVAQGSAATELNPPQVPAPLSRGQFEVSRRGARMNAQQTQVDLFGNWAAMRQQMLSQATGSLPSP